MASNHTQATRKRKRCVTYWYMEYTQAYKSFSFQRPSPPTDHLWCFHIEVYEYICSVSRRFAEPSLVCYCYRRWVMLRYTRDPSSVWTTEPWPHARYIYAKECDSYWNMTSEFKMNAMAEINLYLHVWMLFCKDHPWLMYTIFIDVQNADHDIPSEEHCARLQHCTKGLHCVTTLELHTKECMFCITHYEPA